MPDYSLCQQHECPVKNKCIRYLGEPDDYWQSYIAPEFTKDGCDSFWNVGKRTPFKLKIVALKKTEKVK